MALVRIVLIACLVNMLSGCALVCRHMAMAHYAWAVEGGHNPEFVMFTTTPITQVMSLGIWNAHVQATVQQGGRRLWVSGEIDPALSDGPEYPLGDYCWVMNLDQYVAWLSVNRELSKLPYAPNSSWPRCDIVLKEMP